jgi:hypothetical protein
MKVNENLIKRIENGRKFRAELLKKLPSNIYQLAQLFGKNPATILYHLKILEKEETIFKQNNVLNGRAQAIYAPKLTFENNELLLSKDLFYPTEKEVCFYALSGNSFGISSCANPEWKEKSLFNIPINFKITEEGFIIQLPEKIANFYEIPLNTVRPIYSIDKKQAIFTIF